ncbi:MAG: serine/threonine-protein kinase [Pirellulales bacterium]
MSPTRLGPYEIGDALGKGGMGCVYKAVNIETGERAAVKVLSPQLALADGFRERFEAEIDSLKTLRHDGIVRLFGWGEQDGVLFYSMELVEGTSLEEELKAGRRFTWREVASIAIQLCKALKHAHDHGIIHRDIKPANILLDENERVKLADFGIARLFGSTQLTSAGGVLGTADYMSPEQADGRPVTARCDQYSLGGVMYSLLAGRPPFRARSLPEMLQLQRFAAPDPVRRYAPQTPEQLEQAILQLLSKEPADRFPNTTVVARHLEAMTIALSRPTNDDFDMAEEQVERPPVPSEPGLSMAVTQADPQIMTESGSVPTHRGTMPPADGTDGSVSLLLANDPPAIARSGKRVESKSQSATRFMTVEEEAAQREAALHESPWSMILQWGGLLAGLVAVIGAAWYASRPPSADKLYGTIQSAIERKEPLSSVGREIDQFLLRFPGDDRVPDVTAIKRQRDLDQTARRLDLDGRPNAPNAQSLLSIERIYLQAMELAVLDPEQAAARLKQLIALFGADGEMTPRTETTDLKQAERIANCLALARWQLAELEQQTNQIAASDLDDLRARLAAAKAMAKEQPQRAQEICTAIVELYGRHSWSAPVVNEAQSLLEELKK